MDRTACTEAQCLYSKLNLYSPYVPYSLYRASVPVQYSYTSTPPIGCTAYTEPQCLYSTAIPLLPVWASLPMSSLSACTNELFTFFCMARTSELFNVFAYCNGPQYYSRRIQFLYVSLKMTHIRMIEP